MVNILADINSILRIMGARRMPGIKSTGVTKAIILGISRLEKELEPLVCLTFIPITSYMFNLPIVK